MWWDVGTYQVFAEERIAEMRREAARDRLVKEIAFRGRPRRTTMGWLLSTVIRALLPKGSAGSQRMTSGPCP